MKVYSKELSIRWSDLDPNFHVRHSVYYDWGAFIRVTFMHENGITPAVMQSENIGPILFREECIFFKEIHFGDLITVNVQMVNCTRDMRKWTMRHSIFKNGNELCAQITIDGSWMNTEKRKITAPSETIRKTFEQMPLAEEFQWNEK